MPLLGRHRECGCDCRDADRYQVDTLIYNPLFDIGCGKPPCKYIVHFECNLFDPSNRTIQIAEVNMPMRQLCEFGPTGQYVAIRVVQAIVTSTQFSSIETDGMLPPLSFGQSSAYACTWAERSVRASQTPGAWWTSARAAIGWTLETVMRTVTDVVGNATIIQADLTHSTGMTYRLKARSNWDCFGPNTLYLQDAATWQARYPGLPAFVCITPEITTAVYQPLCCPNCFQANFPQVDSTFDHIPAQRLDFIPFNPGALPFQPYATNSGVCNYAATLIHYASRVADASAEANDQTVLYAGQPYLPVQLSVLSPMNTGLSSVARLYVYYLPTGNIGGLATLIYECPNFTCNGGGDFSVTASAAGFPRVITLTSHKCVSSETNDQGLCPSSHCLDPRYPIARVAGYGTEALRLAACDPWCSCMPGRVVTFDAFYGLQQFGVNCNDGLVNRTPFTGFCIGGRTGLDAGTRPSRELCGEILWSGDGTARHICCVAYVNSSGVWKSDWYCEGTYVATTDCRLTCCPMTLKSTMPAMSCLPGYVGCMAVNTKYDCGPVDGNCCPLANFPATMTVHFVSTCLGTFNVTVTQAGSTWTGSGTDAFADPVTVSFSLTAAPCHLTLSVNGGAPAIFTLTVISCSPPSFSSSITGAISGSSCGLFDVTSLTMS